MKKTLRAFTLAEILITLAIIGVVARVTLPALISNTQKQTAETSLSKAINTLENANNKILTDSSASSLETACGDVHYLACLNKTLNGTLSKDQYNTPLESTAKNQSITLKTKDGITFTGNGTPVALAENAVNKNLPDKYHGSFYTVTIDINGAKTPNKSASDRFSVWVDLYGQVIPYGGLQYAEYRGQSDVKWKQYCQSGKAPTSAMYCTGAIVDNGYQILYKYN